MMQKSRISLMLMLMGVLFLASGVLRAATVTSQADGNWNNTATWDTGTIPAAGDVVIIASGDTVTINVTTATLKSITVQSGGMLDFAAGGYTLNVGSSGLGRYVTVQGTLTINNAGILATSGAPIEISGTCTINSTGGGIDASSSNMTILSGGTLTMTAGEAYCNNLNLSSGGTLNADNGSGAIYIAGNAIVNGAVTTTGTFSSSKVLDVTGDLTVGGTLGVGAATFGANYVVFGTITLSSGSTVNYRSSGSQTIDNSLTYSNLTLSNSGTKSISADLTVDNSMTISGSAVFSNASYDVTIGGSLTNNSNQAQTLGTGSYTFTGTTISGSGTLDFSSATVSFSGTNVTLGDGSNGNGSLTFGSVTFSNANVAITIGANNYSGTVTFSGAVSVSGTNATLTVSSGTTSWISLTMSGSSSSASFSNTSGGNSFSGNVSFGNSLNIGAEFDVTGTTTVTGNLTISSSTGPSDNTNTFTGLVSVAGPTVSITGTNTLNGGFSHTSSDVSSSCAISGTFNASASGTTTTINAVTVTLAGTPSFYNLTISNSSGTFSTTANFSIANTANFSKDLTATGYTITFGTSAPASCMLGAGEIIGTVSRTLSSSSGAYDFTGSNTEFYIPANEFSSGNTITVTLVKSAPDAQAVKRYYDVANTTDASYQPSASASLQLEYDDGDLNGNIEANLKMWYGTYGSAGEGGFSLLSSSQVNTTTNIVWYNFTGSFNFKWRYTMAESTKPLPVELTVFTGRLVNDRVKLRWTTATEVNSYGFVIQRKNSAGEYEEIGFVEGQGTKNTPSHYVFYDRDLPAQGILMYRLKMVDRDGTFEYSDEVEIVAAPGSIGLKQNYPNPFNPRTSITFTAPESGLATLKIYNSAGKEVATIFKETVEAGVQKSAFFDGTGLPSGTYVYVLQVGSYTESRKMMLVK